MANRAHHLLKPEVLAGLGNLELVARCVVDGVLLGLHRSPRFGFSQEFAEYRPYTQGDDPRYIDWNVVARSDRMLIKQFQGETNAHLMIMLDISASMGFGGAAVSKLGYGQMLAASLAYLARRQHDAVGLLCFDEQVRSFRAPSARQGALNFLLAMIQSVQPTGGTNLAPPLERFTQGVRRRGLVAIISDFYCEPETIVNAVAPLSLAGHDSVFFHLLDRAELAPDFRGLQLIEDVETGEKMEVSQVDLRDHYPARMAAHVDAMREAVRGCGAHHVLCPTDEPLAGVLRAYLQARAPRK